MRFNITNELQELYAKGYKNGMHTGIGYGILIATSISILFFVFLIY